MRNNKGFTLIELLAVIAILGILATAIGASAATAFSGRDRKCANGIGALLSQCRVLTMSGAENPTCELQKSGDGYEGILRIGGAEHTRERLAPAQTSVSYTEKGDAEPQEMNGTIIFAFDRETGAFTPVSGKEYSEIQVGRYRIALTASTGRYRITQ